MSIELTPDLRSFVDEQVLLGLYPSAEAVVEAAVLRMMDEASAAGVDRELQSRLEESERQIEDGRDMDWNATVADLRSRYKL